MTSMRFKLSRVFGAFWLRRQDGWFGRFVESRAYLPAIICVAGAGFVFVLAVLGLAVLDHGLAALLWSAVTVATYLLVLLFLTSFGASVAQTVGHDASPAELLARCRKLLEQHDFEIQRATPDRIVAARGARAGAESEWRNFPLEVVATVALSGESATLSVCCTGESAANRFVRGLIRGTAEASAKLDHASLQALDKTLVMRHGGVFQSGLASRVFIALLTCAVVSTVLLAGVSYKLATFVLDFTLASAAADDVRRLQFQLVSGIDAALRLEADRLASMIDKSESRGNAPAEVLPALAPFRAPGEFIAGLVQPDGGVALIQLSRPGSPGARWTPDVYQEVQARALVRLGDKVFRKLPQTQARDLEARLGLKAGGLMIGTALTHGDLARLAPAALESGSLEITFFDSGRPFLRYAWHPGKGLHVDGGSAALPGDVIANAARRLEADWTVIFKDVLFGGDFAGTAIRMERHDGALYRVYYNVSKESGAGTGWDGVSVARSHDPALETREWILPLATSLALIALLPVLILTTVLANLVSNRISRPALQIRDALRSLAEGDYSVRVEPTRSDEIGKLQAQLNQTAGELRKRQSGR